VFYVLVGAMKVTPANRENRTGPRAGPPGPFIGRPIVEPTLDHLCACLLAGVRPRRMR
jgi:hypothetical protein